MSAKPLTHDQQFLRSHFAKACRHPEAFAGEVHQGR
jgi:hypothetical protein